MKNKKKLFVQALIIMAGLSLYSAGVALFILPLDMIAAGTTGMALVAQKLWGVPLSTFIAVFNVMMFVLGWAELGRDFAFSTLVATFYFPFALDSATAIVGDLVLTRDPMLCAICAGVIIGFSLGIVIKAGASTGGTDIPPLVLKKRLNIPIPVTIFLQVIKKGRLQTFFLLHPPLKILLFKVDFFPDPAKTYSYSFFRVKPLPRTSPTWFTIINALSSTSLTRLLSLLSSLPETITRTIIVFFLVCPPSMLRRVVPRSIFSWMAALSFSNFSLMILTWICLVPIISTLSRTTV